MSEDKELDALRQQVKPRRKPGRPPRAALADQRGPAEPDDNPQMNRPSRAEITRRERRMRDHEISSGIRKNLNVPPQIADSARDRKMRLRWVKDTAVDMQKRHDTDWDPVKDENGQLITRAASRSEDTKMVLMEKPEEWVAEEQEARRRAREAQIVARVETGETDPDALVGYNRGNNSISRS